MKIKSLIAAAFLGTTIATMSGCALVGGVSDSVTTTGSQKFPATNPADVIVYNDGSTPSQPFIVIGQESIDATEFYMPRSEGTILQAMRSEAAKIGGQGVINISKGMMNTSATIIRFKTDAYAQAALKEAQEKGLVAATTSAQQ